MNFIIIVIIIVKYIISLLFFIITIIIIFLRMEVKFGEPKMEMENGEVIR